MMNETSVSRVPESNQGSSATLDGLAELTRNCMIGKIRHFSAADRNRWLNHWFGTPNILINVLLGSIFFFSVTTDLPDIAKWVGGGLALLSAACAGIQTFFDFNRLSEGHRNLANRYNALGRQCEVADSRFRDRLSSLDQMAKEFALFSQQYCQINDDAVAFPTGSRDYRKALEREMERMRGLQERERERHALYCADTEISLHIA